MKLPIVSTVTFFCTLLTAIPAAATLIHRYTFDSGAAAVDSVGSANATLFGDAVIAGSALSLDGSGDYAQTSGNKIVPTSGDFSVMLFARQVAFAGGFVEMIAQGNSGAPGFYIGHDPTNIIRVGDIWPSTGVAFPSDGAYHHYAVVRDGGANKTFLYIDGSLAATLGVAIVLAGSDDTLFGAQFGGAGEFFNGSIDDVLIYNDAESASSISQIAANGRSAAPIPGTVALLGLGLAGLGFSRRKQA